jgi:hypothetical protein
MKMQTNLSYSPSSHINYNTIENDKWIPSLKYGGSKTSPTHCTLYKTSASALLPGHQGSTNMGLGSLN